MVVEALLISLTLPDQMHPPAMDVCYTMSTAIGTSITIVITQMYFLLLIFNNLFHDIHHVLHCALHVFKVYRFTREPALELCVSSIVSDCCMKTRSLLENPQFFFSLSFFELRVSNNFYTITYTPKFLTKSP